MDNRNILISEARIAGTSLAFWLKKIGFNPTIIEIAPKLREGGYAIDFMGAGFDVDAANAQQLKKHQLRRKTC